MDRIEKMRPERVYFLGDAVGYFPGVEAVRYLYERRDVIECLSGNHEVLLKSPQDSSWEAIAQHDSVRGAMTDELWNFLSLWPSEIRLQGSNFKVVMRHARFTKFGSGTVKSVSIPGSTPNPLWAVVHGHSHRPSIRVQLARALVDVGSVGLPRDVGRMGSFVILDLEVGVFEIHRFPIWDSIEQIVGEWGRTLHPNVVDTLKRKNDVY